MLAVSATGTLSLLDASELKRAPSLTSACLSLTHTASSSTWSFDNTALFLASSQIVHRYDPISNVLKDIHHSTSAESISHILCKDKATLIYSVGDKVHLLECGSSVKVIQTIESHKSSITSLSLSNDCTLLATTSSNAVHVHNLTLGSHTTLRGIALGGQNITTSAFHPHGRTRLLIGIGKQLLVYDTTRPSAPLKIITLNEATSGDIVAIACSPFSKTLVAVATSAGYVGLIDLEKEKGLFRTLNVKVPLTTLTFSAEGAALYLGTEHGKLLILDLRALDKAPKAIIISEIGSRIETMSVQRKNKAGEASAKPTPVAASKPVEPPDTGRRVSALTASKPPTKDGTTPSRARIARVGSTSSPARRLPSAMSSKETEGLTKRTPKKSLAEKKIFSPVRDPLGNSAGDISVQIETSKGVDSKSTQLKPPKRSSMSPFQTVSPKVSSISAISSRTASLEDQLRRTRTVAATTRAHKPSSTSIEPSAESGVRLSTRSTDGERVSSRRRAGSSASRPSSGATTATSVSTSARTVRPGSSASRPDSRLRHASPPTVPPLPLDIPLPQSRTPSPELPDIHDPVTPIPAMKRAKSHLGMEVLGLGSPEVDRWIRAGKGQGKNEIDRKGKGKTVGFEDNSDDDDDDDDEHEERERERERSLSMQISPRRPSTSWQPSPVRNSPGNLNNSGHSAHDLLRTIIKDVMYDFQRETRAEMTGLHLDLVRMGRGWKRELRELMQEYAGGLEELREENRKLREENERLRRGY